MKCPQLLPSLVIADDARLAAQVSCVLARPRTYLSVVDGPRMTRLDHEAEVIRRNNAAARVKPSSIVFAGLTDDAGKALLGRLPPKLVTHVSQPRGIHALPLRADGLRVPSLTWGRDRIGIGLLKALRARTNIEFLDAPSPIESVPPKSGHLVVCEAGEDLSEVIAANYAYALGAGLCLIPEVDRNEAEEILERLYSVYEDRQTSPTLALEQLKRQLQELCGPLPIPPSGSITFVTGRLPYGFAFPDTPSTHLFKYPDLGLAVINGLAAEQPGTRGVNVAVLVDPEKTDAPEIAAAAKLLPGRGIFVRGYSGSGANVTDVTQMVELFPYDLLLIATHCGDAPGYRWTYEFKDSEGIDRKLVVDVAIGVGHTDQDDIVHVTQFQYFHSLDGVDWHDPKKEEKLYVGMAIHDFIERTRAKHELEPVKKEDIPRVVSSAALGMYDHNFIALPRSLASEGTPIIINNACVSWHRLAETFTFGNARAYVGTLFPVSTTEAHDVIVNLLDKQFGKPLPTALWSAQRRVYGDGKRRPYVVTGVYPQRLRGAPRDVPRDIARKLVSGLAAWRAKLSQTSPDDKDRATALKANVGFYEREIAAFRARWPETIG
jgi:hypothetical protein